VEQILNLSYIARDVVFYPPKYAALTRGFCVSALAVSLNTILPFSSTQPRSTFNGRKLSFWFAEYGLTPLIPLPPSLPAWWREKKGGEEGEVAGGKAARHFTHSFLNSPCPAGIEQATMQCYSMRGR